MSEKCHLLLDSYGGQNDDNMYNEVDIRQNCCKLLERLIIPPKTTSYLQPCNLISDFFDIAK